MPSIPESDNCLNNLYIDLEIRKMFLFVMWHMHVGTLLEILIKTDRNFKKILNGIPYTRYNTFLIMHLSESILHEF